MKLFAISILLKDEGGGIGKLCSAYDLSSFGYFQTASVREFMDFTSKIVVERSLLGQKLSITEREYVCHVFVRGDRLSCVLISDSEYPGTVGFSLMKKVMDEFTVRFPSIQVWKTAKPQGLNFPELEKFLKSYQLVVIPDVDDLQDPKSVDALTKLQSDVDETKVVLHNTLEMMLDRGEKLDDLVTHSEELTLQAKTFYLTAKKTNQCCVVL